MSKLTLTIYIPSFNREEFLKKQLDSIFINYSNVELEVFVNDNNSDKGNYNNIKKICEERDFNYKKNFINIGGNPNILNGFLLNTNSKYLWILSDNDLLKNDSIKSILDILNSSEIDLLFLSNTFKNSYKIYEYSQFDIIEKLLIQPTGLGLISNVIYNRKFIKDSISYGFDFIPSWFPHLAILLKSFHNKTGKIGIINRDNFFESDEVSHIEWDKFNYARSYFGYVFLAELLEKQHRRYFLRKFSKFWNLRHWFFFKKSKNLLFNEIFAYGYLSRYIPLFRCKIFLWKIIYFFYPTLKKIVKLKK